MTVNANKVFDALELLNGYLANAAYSPELFRLRGLLIEALTPAPKRIEDADGIDDELVWIGEDPKDLRIIDKPTNRQYPE